MDKKYLILVSGKMRTGKNTFAELFKNKCIMDGYSIKIDSYASVLKQWCKEEFKALTDYLNNFRAEVRANVPIFEESRFGVLNNQISKVINKIYTKDENWFEDKNDITRLILQIVGTNLFRKHVDDDFWIKEFIKKAKDYKEKYVVVTDARFPNEIDLPHKLIEDRMVVSVNIKRDTKEKSNHFSETALDKYKWFDYIIDNNGDMNLLKQSVNTIFKDIQTLISL